MVEKGELNPDNEEELMKKLKFILWSKKDGPLPKKEDGSINTGGVLGLIDENNVYLTTYAEYPDERRPADLEVGDCIGNVKYRLGGEAGVYDVYRVK